MNFLVIFDFLFAFAVGAFYLYFVILPRDHGTREDGGSQVNKDETEESWPTVSIVIAARNEEHNILRCLDSVAHIHYPRNKVEILVVDDGSRDRTAELVEQYCRSNSMVRLVMLDKTAFPELAGKQAAQETAVRLSNGEFLLFTDADCIVKPLWAKEMICSFDETTGLVAGSILVQGSNILNRLINTELLLNTDIAARKLQAQRPIALGGGNMAVRRKAFFQIGGYEGLGFSLIEECDLAKKLVSTTNWDLRFCLSERALVRTVPMSGVPELLEKRRRWLFGARRTRRKGIADLKIPLIMPLAFIAGHLLCAWFLPMCFVAAGFLFLAKTAGDILVVTTIRWFPLHRPKVILAILAVEVFQVLLFVRMCCSLLAGRGVTWKGRTYEPQRAGQQSSRKREETRPG